jgi:hypothetical protein
VGPQAGLDKVMKRKISANAGNQTLDIKQIANHNTAILKTSVPTSQKHTLSLYYKNQLLLLFTEIITLYSDNYINTYMHCVDKMKFPNAHTQ